MPRKARLQQAQAQLAQFNADRDYSISLAGLTGFLNGTPTMSGTTISSARRTRSCRRSS